MNFNDELTLLLKARYPIIFIDTIEEDRAEYVIRKAIKSSFNRSIYSWILLTVIQIIQIMKDLLSEIHYKLLN